MNDEDRAVLLKLMDHLALQILIKTSQPTMEQPIPGPLKVMGCLMHRQRNASCVTAAASLST